MADDTTKNLGVYVDDPDAKGFAAHQNDAAGLRLMTNNSGGSLSTGDVVVLDTSADESVTTTTTEADDLIAFVVPQDITGDDVATTKTILNGEKGWVYGPGAYCPAVNVDGAVDVGEFLITSTTAGDATGSGAVVGTNAAPQGAFAIALEAAAGAGSVAALLVHRGKALMPERWFAFHEEAQIENGNGLARTADSAQRYGGYVHQSAAADGDIWTHSVNLETGNYTMYILCLTTSGSGILDLSMDGTDIWTGIDFYSGSTTKNVLKFSVVAVSGSKRHVLRGTVNGKNASSSGHEIRITAMWVQPVDDSEEG